MSRWAAKQAKRPKQTKEQHRTDTKQPSTVMPMGWHYRAVRAEKRTGHSRWRTQITTVPPPPPGHVPCVQAAARGPARRKDRRKQATTIKTRKRHNPEPEQPSHESLAYPRCGLVCEDRCLERAAG
jgi:hypothetical protein